MKFFTVLVLRFRFHHRTLFLMMIRLPLSFKMFRPLIFVLCLVPSASFLTPAERRPSSSLFVHKGPKQKKITIKELQRQIMESPDIVKGKKNTKSKKSGRSRKKVDNPKQKYVYAAQRSKMQREGKLEKELDDGKEISQEAQDFIDEHNPIQIARELGLSNAANQHSEALVDDIKPRIVGQIRVGDGNGSDAYAYLVEKPAGWAILGGANSSKKKTPANKKEQPKTSKNKMKRVKIKGGDGSDDYLEFNEDDVLALLSPEERAEYEAEGIPLLDTSGPVYDDTTSDITYMDIPGWYDVANMSAEEREEAGIEDEDFDPKDIPDFNEADMLALMSPEEAKEYNQEKNSLKIQQQEGSKAKNPMQKYESVDLESLDPVARENLKRIETRQAQKKNDQASFTPYSRPSVVSWLKEFKADEGIPIRGGKFWTAAAGATEVDDSGLLLLCPKSNVNNVFVDLAEYVAVVGNGSFLRHTSKKDASIPKEMIDMSIISKVKKGREGDTCQTVRFAIPEHLSTCSSIISHAQAQFDDGIRGDPAANPFDRRGPRRLIHCQALSVSSLVHDEDVQAETESLPDDIGILSDRLNNHAFYKGSFLGRASLRENELTTSYREINGAADGFPGWTIDRYGEWLLVQHDRKEYKGPLPSIHDGKTAGVYYLPSNQDRSAMGSSTNIRPTLLEGKPAPEVLPVLENGVTYHLSLDKDLSTGIFLDQRLHRAWLTRNCNQDTHVLNCFAHCGAFSIAAATAGASTVSMDLSKKWLDRVEPQVPTKIHKMLLCASKMMTDNNLLLLLSLSLS
jgi:hypothetical protein